MEARMFDYEFSIPYPAPDTTYKDNIIFVNKENEEGKEYTIIIKLKNPEFIEGNNQIYHQNNPNDMTFVMSIEKEELDTNGSIYIDGKLLDKNNYVLDSNENGVSISLKKDYVAELDYGVHEIKVRALYGEVISTFTKKQNIINPETGNKILTIFMLMIISSGLVIIFNKKKKQLI